MPKEEIIIGQNDKGDFIGIDKYKKLMDDIPNLISRFATCRKMGVSLRSYP
jgi:hypothetical protein